MLRREYRHSSNAHNVKFIIKKVEHVQKLSRAETTSTRDMKLYYYMNEKDA